MSAVAPRPDTDRLAGLIERVTFHNADSGFCVLRLKVRGERDLITLVGHAPAVTPGEYASASGQWVTDREHGRQFKAAFVSVAPPHTLEGIERYLGSGMVKGIGPVYAQRLGRGIRHRRVRHHRAHARAPARSRGHRRQARRARSRPAGPTRRSSARSWCSCTRTASRPRARCASSRPTGPRPSRWCGPTPTGWHATSAASAFARPTRSRRRSASPRTRHCAPAPASPTRWPKRRGRATAGCRIR